LSECLNTTLKPRGAFSRVSARRGPVPQFGGRYKRITGNEPLPTVLSRLRRNRNVPGALPSSFAASSYSAPRPCTNISLKGFACCLHPGSCPTLHVHRMVEKVVTRFQRAHKHRLVCHCFPPERFNRSACLGFYRHLDKPIPLRLVRLLIPPDRRRFYCTMRCEQRTKLLVGVRSWKVTYINLHGDLTFSMDDTSSI